MIIIENNKYIVDVDNFRTAFNNASKFVNENTDDYDTDDYTLLIQQWIVDWKRIHKVTPIMNSLTHQQTCIACDFISEERYLTFLLKWA